MLVTCFCALVMILVTCHLADSDIGNMRFCALAMTLVTCYLAGSDVGNMFLCACNDTGNVLPRWQ